MSWCQTPSNTRFQTGAAARSGSKARSAPEIAGSRNRQYPDAAIERNPGDGIEIRRAFIGSSLPHLVSGGGRMRSAQSHRILVVEDEGLIAHDIAQRLEALGHEVIGQVGTAGEAVEKAAQAD